jgi:hypothetical protein
VLAGVVAVASPQRAGAQASVVTDACGALDPVAVGELIDLELGGRAVSRGLTARVRCAEAAIEIDVYDPLTEKRIGRAAPGVDPSDPGAPRVIALLVSELVVASWAELLLGSAAPHQGVDPDQARAAMDRAARELASPVAERDPPEAEEPPPQRAPERTGTTAPSGGTATSVTAEVAASPLSLSGAIDVGARARDLAAPLATLDLGIRGVLWPTPDLGIGARLSGEIGEAARTGSGVLFASLGAGVVLAWLPVRLALFELELALEGRLAWSRLEGRSRAAGITSHALDALLGDAEVTVTPTLRIAPLELGLVLRAGASFAGPTGQVDGEASVTIPGLVLGASLRIGITDRPSGGS